MGRNNSKSDKAIADRAFQRKQAEMRAAVVEDAPPKPPREPITFQSLFRHPVTDLYLPLACIVVGLLGTSGWLTYRKMLPAFGVALLCCAGYTLVRLIAQLLVLPKFLRTEVPLGSKPSMLLKFAATSILPELAAMVFIFRAGGITGWILALGWLALVAGFMFIILFGTNDTDSYVCAFLCAAPAVVLMPVAWWFMHRGLQHW